MSGVYLDLSDGPLQPMRRRRPRPSSGHRGGAVLVGGAPQRRLYLPLRHQAGQGQGNLEDAQDGLSVL